MMGRRSVFVSKPAPVAKRAETDEERAARIAAEMAGENDPPKGDE